MKVTVVAVSLPGIGEVCRYARKHPEFEFCIAFVGQLSSASRDFLKEIPDSDAVLVDLMGVGQPLYGDIVKALRKCKGVRICCGGMSASLGRLGGFDEDDFETDDEDENVYYELQQAWMRADPGDIEFIFDTALGKYLGVKGLPTPEFEEVREGSSIRDPVSGRTWVSKESFYKDNPRDPSKGEAVLLYTRNNYPTRNVKTISLLYDRLGKVANVVPIAVKGMNDASMKQMSELVGTTDAIVNTIPFRFSVGPTGGDASSTATVLSDMGAAYVKPFLMSGNTCEEWRSNNNGLDPMQFTIQMFLPELDGAVCIIPVGFSEETERFDEFGITAMEVLPVEERCDRVAGKVKGYLNLKNKPNREKKIAILSYNYPPGEGNLFGGSFLDGAGSLSSMLDTLIDAGYVADRMSSDEILNAFLRNGMLNEGDWISPSEQVIRTKGTRKHPAAVSEKWGKQPGKVMVSKGKYLIPGIVDGNIFIGLQPPRTSTESDSVSDYHDKHVPPHHQYMAVYEWLQDEFGVDAIVHLGTHGTIEFLPGKEAAMSGECYPDMILGNVPHVYVYYSGNTSEAMIAKRRSHAGIVSYMGVPFVRSGLYGDLVKIEEMIAEYREALKTDTGRADSLMEGITAAAMKMRLPTDIEELEDEMIRIRDSLIPRGLHRFGVPFDEDDSIGFACNSMEFPHGDIADLSSKLAPFDLSPDDVIAEYIRSGKMPPELEGDDEAAKALEYAERIAGLSRSCDERTGLLTALGGGYVDAKPGGDPMKDPDVLPSGHNLVQFNPDRVPSRTAFERGVAAAGALIGQYRKENGGKYPRSAALVLWGLETSRTQGMSIGQICGFLGIRMRRDSGRFIDRFELIPDKELGRPRVDVVISMCGFFRDMFPGLVDGISELFGMVNRAPDANVVKEDTARNRGFLKDKYKGDDLEDLAQCRLFGPDRAKYGTDGVTDAVGSSNWKEERELGEMFESSLCYAYSGRFKGTEAPGLLAFNHETVDLVSQVRDSADREIIDLDHYYEFLGGLSKAVENAKGKKASVFVVDGSGPKISADSAKRSVERGIRTRLLNPKWINGLLEVKYHGAQEINGRFENVLGLAATIGCVEEGVFRDMFDVYVRDEDMRKRVRENNNWAYMSMLNRLSEADERGYWKATDEEIDVLKKAYEESEEKAEQDTDDI